MSKARLSLVSLVPLASFALLALADSVLPVHAGGIAGDLDQQIQAASSSRRLSSQMVRVIVQYKDALVNPRSLAPLNGSLSHFSFDMAYRIGGVARFSHNLINGATLEVPLGSIRKLAADPRVAWVSPDRVLKADSDFDVQTMGADQVWLNPGVRGTGVGIAVLDTGVNINPDFSHFNTSNSQLVAWQDFVNGKTAPYDDNGHGTHVAGIALGSGNLSNGTISGSAPDANLIACKVLDASGSGAVSNVINALNWCVLNKNTYNIRVINLSLGQMPRESYKTDPLCVAVRSAIKADIVVVCAAGNLGKNSLGVTQYGGIHAPGNEPAAITVGALNTMGTPQRSDDTVDTYSSRGPTAIDQQVKPDLVAPGNKIVSVRSPGSYLDVTYPANQVAYDPTQPVYNYFTLSGTSMASPEVAGVVALMLQANSKLKPGAVKGILMFTAQRLNLNDALGNPLTAGLSLLTQGAGSVNAAGAIEVSTKVNAGASIGSPWLTATLSNQTTIAGESVIWSDSILYGNQLITGAGLMRTAQPLWGDSVIWGDSVVWDDSVIWTDNGVAADAPVWTTNSVTADSVIEGDSYASSDNILTGGD